MAGRASIRASDVDRERVAEQLREAGGEGRLLTAELEERLEAAFAARTYGQLDAVLSDLPASGHSLPSRRASRGAGGLLRPTLTGALALLLVVLVAIVVLAIATGVFAGWLLWIVAGWWFWGRHGRRRPHPRARQYGYARRSGRMYPGRGF